MKKPTARDYKLVDSLVNSPCNPDLCASLDHTERDQHSHFGDCPILARVRAAWARIVAAKESEAKP